MLGMIVLALVVIFVAIVTIRTLNFKPHPQPKTVNKEYKFDKDASVDALAQLVRCKTISYAFSKEREHSLEKGASELGKHCFH